MATAPTTDVLTLVTDGLWLTLPITGLCRDAAMRCGDSIWLFTVLAASGCAASGPTLFSTHTFDGPARHYAQAPAVSRDQMPTALRGDLPVAKSAELIQAESGGLIQTVAATAPVPPAPVAEGDAAPTPAAAGGMSLAGPNVPPVPGQPIYSPGPTPHEIACRAAAHSTSVALLKSERALIRETRNTSTQPALLFDRVLGYRTAARANEAAGAALTVYHELAAGTAALAATDRSLAEINAALKDREAAGGQGLVAAGYDLDARRDNLQRRREELAAGLAAGQARLEAMVGGPVPLPLVDSPPLVPQPPSVQQAVAEGLGARADLNLLRTVIRQLERRTLPIAVGVLQQFDPAVGVAPPDFLPCNWIAADARAATRRRQLCTALSRQEELIAGNVEAAVLILQGIWEQHARAEEAVAHREAEVSRLESRRDVDLEVSGADITAARLERLGAEAERDRLAHEYQKSEANLRTLQGLLAVECGYMSPPACLAR